MLYYSRRRRYYNEARARATEMRNNPTRAEAKMYDILYSQVVSKYPEHIFYRQSAKFSKYMYYILDFYCPTLNLGIEVDGSTHNDRETYDEHRDAVLGRKNIQVFRFSNHDVLYDPQGVATRLCQIVQEKATHRGFISAPSYTTTSGQTVQEKTNRNSKCFIATAAYGTPMAREINILRRFRDQEMEPNRIGKHLVTLYYETSPFLASVIARSKNMQAFVRTGLKPIIRIFDEKYSIQRA